MAVREKVVFDCFAPIAVMPTCPIMFGIVRFYITIPLICCIGFLLIGRIASATYESTDSEPKIVIDGSFQDWINIPIAAIDAIDSPESEIDFQCLKITDSGQFVHLLVEFGKSVSIQNLDGSLHIILDVDGNENTGQLFKGLSGADIDIILSPPDLQKPGHSMGGVVVNSLSQAFTNLNKEKIGFVFAPTHESKIFEFRINRSLLAPDEMPLFSNKMLHCKFVYEDTKLNLNEETAIIEHALIPLSTKRILQDSDPLKKSDKALRIVTWNTNNGSILSNPDPFVRCLNALSPDVILLQEISNKSSAAQLKAFLNQNVLHNNAQPWRVVIGAGGGNLRTAIASTHSICELEQFKFVTYLNQAKRSVRQAGAAIEISGKQLLCVSVHLRCCGSTGSHEDQIRIQEVKAILSRLSEVLRTKHVDGVIIAGDFNLVGSTQPLDLLTNNLDISGLTLLPVKGLQIDGKSNATWSDANEPYAMGRLDYLLHSQGKLKLLRNFVLDTLDLAPKWLEYHNLKESDSHDASDHLPLVADVIFFQ